MSWIFRKLERPCGKRNNCFAFAETAGKAQTSGGNDQDEERALREQLARLCRSTATWTRHNSPGYLTRLRPYSDTAAQEAKAILRDKIRLIEDQLTPDIIA